LANSLGYSAGELHDMKLSDLLNLKPEEIRNQVLQIIQQVGGTRQTWPFLKKDGSPLTLEITGSRFRYGGKGQILVFGREIATVPRLQLTQFPEEEYDKKSYQPVAADSQTGNKINQFKNILSTLILQTEDTLQELPPGAETRHNLEEILRSSMKAKDLIRDLVIPIPATLSAAEPVKTKGEHILLVDDETQLCHLEEKLLKRMGYRVSAFTDSLEALKAFQKNPDSFDLVITDSSMSQLPGLDLAKAILRQRPKLPVILATGFGDKDKINLAKQIGIRECIEKPILSGDLDKTIQRVFQQT
jgi:CheY-like chemotaxis protein